MPDIRQTETEENFLRKRSAKQQTRTTAEIKEAISATVTQKRRNKIKRAKLL